MEDPKWKISDQRQSMNIGKQNNENFLVGKKRKSKTNLGKIQPLKEI